MSSIMDLVRGTQKVLPTAIKNVDDAAVIQDIKTINFEGTKVKLYIATVRSATGSGTYKAQIAFTGIDSPSVAKPSLTKDSAKVRCSCMSYRHWFSFPNRKFGAAWGARFSPYTRVTPIDDPRYPPKNPDEIPGVCKHIMKLVKMLQQKKEIQ